MFCNVLFYIYRYRLCAKALPIMRADCPNRYRLCVTVLPIMRIALAKLLKLRSVNFDQALLIMRNPKPAEMAVAMLVQT